MYFSSILFDLKKIPLIYGLFVNRAQFFRYVTTFPSWVSRHLCLLNKVDPLFPQLWLTRIKEMGWLMSK